LEPEHHPERLIKMSNPNPPEVCDKLLTYRFISDYAVITFTVPIHSSWSEEMCDSAGWDDLASYVTSPNDYYLDDAFETEVK
jgi:hypothetical protein